MVRAERADARFPDRKVRKGRSHPGQAIIFGGKWIRVMRSVSIGESSWIGVVRPPEVITLGIEISMARLCLVCRITESVRACLY